MADFQEGDLVQLKSGSPDMTVESIYTQAGTGNRKATVSWFEDGERKQENFSVDALVPVEEG